jgi:Xaa-Pro aminopeptidase
MMNWLRRLVLRPFPLLLLAAAGAGATAPDPVPMPEYRERRIRLAEALREELAPGALGVLVLHSAPEPVNLAYRQESNLYYLTGTEIPRSTLVLLFRRGSGGGRKSGPEGYAEYLYLPSRDPRQERWSGTRPGAGALRPDDLQPDEERLETMRLTGFDRPPEEGFPPRHFPRGPIEGAGDLSGHLVRLLSGAGALFHLADPVAPGDPLSGDLAFLRDIRDRFPSLPIRDPAPALARLRSIKSEAEIRQLRHAVAITCRAHAAAMRRVAPGVPEYQVQAEMERQFTFEGARRPGYPSIIGSGENSCVLHYDASERTLGSGELVLMDAGAEFRRYSADLTRTVPVGGRFSEEQLKIYRVVLAAQTAAIAAIRPGVPFPEIDRTARKVITAAGYGAYFTHGTSHFIGLDVHDAGDTGGSLRPGMVLTVEPGIYLPEKSLGIRIEDDVRVTATGAEVLSDCLPRDPHAVEMQMRESLSPASR